MADDFLLVPMRLDAMVLNQQASAATPFLRFQMQYERLAQFESADQPFAGASPDPPTAGIYLHWTLPAALRHGNYRRALASDDPRRRSPGYAEEGDGDGMVFPLIPNRWLVVRTEQGAPPAAAVKAWVLESDALGGDATSAYVNPRTLAGGGVPTPTRVGKKHRFDATLRSLPEQAQPFLQAVGPGNVNFAHFAPGVENVLAFVDPVTGNDETEHDAGTPIDDASFTYTVVGWYSDPAHDPLQGTAWNESGDPGASGLWVNDSFDWSAYTGTSAPPKQSLLHASLNGVAWSRGSHNESGTGYPEDIAANVRVAVGNTAVDALAAIVRLDRNSAAEADLLEAFQYGLLDQLDEPGAPELLDMAIRQHWFGASSGGTLWSVAAEPREGDTSAPAPATPALTHDQAEALAALNAHQAELDRQRRILQSMQWRLYALWWKGGWQAATGNQAPVTPPFRDWLKTQIPLQVAGTGRDGSGWYADAVREQQGVVDGLVDAVGEAAGRLDAALVPAPDTPPDVPRLRAKELRRPQFFHPTDPVVLVTGLGRATNLDPVEAPVGRLASQTVTALTVGGSRYSADGSGGVDVRPLAPVLDDPNGLLPDGVQQLLLESFFLSPALFAQAVGGGVAPGEVTAGIAGLPAPGAGARFAPPAMTFAAWAQPWVPLILDWQVTVFCEPAYGAQDGDPFQALQRENWSFEGTDFRWVGPTTAGADDFNPAGKAAEMQLTGRTFITPHLSFSLADQLHQFVTAHQLRDPALEALLEDLEAYIEKVRSQDILSQRLGGMISMMVQRLYAQTVPVPDDHAHLIGDSHHGHPMPRGLRLNPLAAPPWEFAPMAGTFFVIDKLTVIDSFGRTVDLTLSNFSTYPSDGSPPENYFFPIAGRGVAAPSPPAVQPAPGQRGSTDATQRMLQLPPRAIQDAQLAFTLTSNDGSDANVEWLAGGNPVCGWIVPNHLDRSLAVYSPEGEAWGELFLARHAGDVWVAVWQPDPTSDGAPQDVGQIPNPYLRSMLQALVDRSNGSGKDAGDGGAGFADFVQVIDETLWGVNPKGQRSDQNLSVLIGRPLAVVRAELALRLRGLPYLNQDWWNTFAVDPSDPGDPGQPAPLATLDGGVTGYSWPVRLGSYALREDGLIGYFLDDPSNPAGDWATFNSVHLPGEATSGHPPRLGERAPFLRQIGADGNYIPLHFVDDTVAAPDPAKGELQRVTMLLDPRGSVHAFTGLLPVRTLEVPSTFVTGALRRMLYLFRAGPFLTPPDAVRLPRPAERRGTWAWYDNVLAATVAPAQSDDRVRFPLTSPRVKEGWLKFVPNPPIEGD